MQKVPYAMATCVVAIGVFVVPLPSFVTLIKVAKANVGVHHLHQARLHLLQARLRQVHHRLAHHRLARLLLARLHQVHLHRVRLHRVRLPQVAQKDPITDVEEPSETLHVIQEGVVVSIIGVAVQPLIVEGQAANTNVGILSFLL